ncbi:MAG: penicillin acylase family protein [Acidobacteriota bacterium]|nr:penicillin acylase family protein [Blastocatellia bacterium]MDW8412100.1 penicillin acylase family protein [Acidobacteriota bacterium]
MKKTWFWTGLGLLAGAGLAAGSIYAWKKTSERFQPQTSGKLSFKQLNSRVEVLRDRWGVPHIYAESEADLLFAQGYVHAQDRLWQMEINRRVPQGRLSAILGEAALELDLLAHRTGLVQVNETASDEESLKLLDSYCAGINAFIEQDRLPIEFSILRHKPSPWSPQDVAAVGRLMAWSLSGNHQIELVRARTARRLGRVISKLTPFFPKGYPVIFPPGSTWEGSSEPLNKAYSLMPLIEQGGGSNNWTVSGTLTETGKPILANDPHLALQMPNIWYELHLCCPTLEAIGATIPGIPFVAIGHNRRIAWGVTSAMADVQDLFIERFHDSDEELYLYDGTWHKAEKRHIKIDIRGGKLHEEDILLTAHGPVVANLDKQHRLSLSWVGHTLSNEPAALLALNRASNWQEFRSALAKWQLPTLNFVYADVDGNIGYQLAGRIPVRNRYGGIVPLPGWDKANDWQGTVPFEELPSCLNPEQGFVVTANNKLTTDDFPYNLGSDFATGYRAERITKLLTSCKKVTVSDSKRIQLDCYTIPGKRFAELLVSRLKKSNLSPIAQKALDILAHWDGQASVDSSAETIYQSTMEKLLVAVFSAHLGEDLAAFLGTLHIGSVAMTNGLAGRMLPVVLEHLTTDDPLLPELAGKASWTELLESSFFEAVNELSRKLGSEPSKWHWGKLHKVSLNHPLGVLPGLRKLFNRGPIPFPGDSETPAQAAFIPLEGFEAKSWMPSYRQIIDLSDFDKSMMIIAGGQCGSPFSSHYDDFIKPWAEGKLHPMLFARQSIEQHLEAKLELLPGLKLIKETEYGRAQDTAIHA